MNRLNNLGSMLAIIIFAANPIFAQESAPIKWGVSVGSGSTTFERSTLTEIDGSQVLKNEEADFVSTIATLSARKGKHQFSFSTNTADEENMSLSGSYFTDLAATTASNDFDDKSFTYTYELTNKWRASIGWNALSMDEKTGNTTTYNNAFINSDFEDWQVAQATSSSTERSGATALLSYVQPLGASNKWVAVGRLGFTAQDYEKSGKGTTLVSGVSQAAEDCYSGVTCNVSTPTFINGDGYNATSNRASDSTAVVYGFSLIYVFDNRRHTLNFDFNFRDNDYEKMTEGYNSTPIGGLFTGGDNTSAVSLQGEAVNDDIEETVSSFSIKWRYGLN